MSTIIENLGIAVGLDFDKKGLNNVQRGLDSLAESGKNLIKGFLAFESIKMFAGFIDQTITAADTLNDIAQRIGTTTQVIQSLGYAAQLSGSSQEAMVNSLKFVTKAASGAASGSKETADAFRKLGVSVYGPNKQLKTADQLLVDAADGFARIKNPTEKAALAMELFGKAGNEMVPFLSQGSAAILELQKEAFEMGAVFDKTFVANAAKYRDNTDRLGMAFKGAGGLIAREFLPNLIDITEGLIQWYKANGKLIAQGIGVFVKGLINGGQQLVKSLDWVYHSIKKVGEYFPQFSKIAMLALAPIVAYAAIAASPWLAMFAGISLVLLALDDIKVWFEGGDSLISRFIKSLHTKFDSGKDGVSEFVRELLRIAEVFRTGGIDAAMLEMWKSVDKYLDLATKRFQQFYKESGLEKIVGAVNKVSSALSAVGISSDGNKDGFAQGDFAQRYANAADEQRRTGKNSGAGIFSGVTDALDALKSTKDSFNKFFLGEDLFKKVDKMQGPTVSDWLKQADQHIVAATAAPPPVSSMFPSIGAGVTGTPSVNSSPTINNTVTINAAGMSQEELTNAVQEAMTSGLQVEIQNAYNAVVPGVR